MRILCFESGGTKLVAALADRDGRLIRTSVAYRDPGQTADRSLQRLVEMGRELCGSASPLAVGFGYGGGVDRELGRPLRCYHEDGWEATDPIALFEKEFRAPAFIENDCNLAALGEACFGAGVGMPSLLYLTLGTGIGAGFVLHGRLLRLSRMGEMELGHTVVDPDGLECPCGNRGCLETVASGPGLQRLAELRLGCSITTIQLMKHFRKGSPEGLAVVQEAAGHLARVLASAINLLAPAAVVLGGGVMQDNQPFLELVQRLAHPLIFPPLRQDGPRYRLSSLREHVVCQGAAAFAAQSLEKCPDFL